MRTFFKVLKAIRQWLVGSALFVALAWVFLKFAEDNAQPSAWLSTVEYWWVLVSSIIGIIVGYPFYQLCAIPFRRLEAMEKLADGLTGTAKAIQEQRKGE